MAKFKLNKLTFTSCVYKTLCSSRKHSYSPRRRDGNFLGGARFSKTKYLKKSIKLNWNFRRGWRSWKKSPFCTYTHECESFSLGFLCLRKVEVHFIAIKVCIVRGAYTLIEAECPMRPYNSLEVKKCVLF